ncbi:MAG: hypothetical protein U0W24_12620 [Bacteroidales bacterium]
MEGEGRSVFEGNKIKSRLKLLAVFYWIMGGFGLLISLILGATGIIQVLVTNHPFMFDNITTIGSDLLQSLAPLYFFCLFVFLSFGILHTIQGFKLKKVKNLNFSRFVAIYSILAFPFGTMLGIITLFYLSQKELRNYYKVDFK